MRVLLQRVRRASVEISGRVVGKIDSGLLVLVGVESEDTSEDIDWLCGKISRLRIFADDAGKMNLSVTDTGGGLLVISQFTLFASTRKGNRPGFVRSAPPATAIPLYEEFVRRLATVSSRDVQTGVFGADMQVSLINDGPVTIWMDSKNRE